MKKYWSLKKLNEIHDNAFRLLVALYSNPNIKEEDYNHNAIVALRASVAYQLQKENLKKMYKKVK